MNKKTNTSWFDVDKEGLSKLMHRGDNRAFLIYELVQNAWDEASKRVDIKFDFLSPKEFKTRSIEDDYAVLTVTDDNPEGFTNLTHAYTLFAESDKKSDPKKRGRFNVGEKLVLACCKLAGITTTKGTIKFNADGTREELPNLKRKIGSQFVAEIYMSKKEYYSICNEVHKLIPPCSILTTFNGKQLFRGPKLTTFQTTLPTEISDAEGNLRPTERKCKVDVYESFGEAMIYEMGIPVVKIDDKYDIDIQQKVPLSIDRTNVTPSYLKRLRTKVLNETYMLLDKEEASQPWVQEASSNKECSVDAITKVINLKYGEKRVSFDLSDSEANKLAMSKGYTIVTGGALSKGQWENVRKAKAVLPAGKVTPSPKPYGKGPILKTIPFDKWTPQMKRVATFVQNIADRTMKHLVEVRITNDPGLKFCATYGPGGPLVLHKKLLGNNFFDSFPHNINKVLSLIIHEFGHEYSSDHLSAEYHRALCDLGTRCVEIALNEPEVFE